MRCCAVSGAGISEEGRVTLAQIQQESTNNKLKSKPAFQQKGNKTKPKQVTGTYEYWKER